MDAQLRVLDQAEIETVSGGLICGGLCVLTAIGAGIGFFTAGVEVGKAIGEATK